MQRKQKYRVGIIGGGIGGLMAAYALSQMDAVEVVLFEKGKAIQDRSCPILAHKIQTCVKCNPCDIMTGMAGAGAFSDGKYNITTEYGGWLQDIKGNDFVIDYIERADSVLLGFGATAVRHNPDNELKKLCIQNNLQMLQGQCKHLGTDGNYSVMCRLINYLQNQDNVTILDNAEVWGVEYPVIKYAIKKESSYEQKFDSIIFAVGRTGSQFFASWCKDNLVPMTNNQVDIGVRVELPAMVWEDFEARIYEPKISYRSSQYGDTTRMFCFNGRGEVVTENTNGIITVNGHAYSDELRKTQNTNFALLSTNRFTQPFDKPLDYARHVAGLANMLAGGGVLVQRLGDLENGRRTDAKRLAQSTVQPTLKGAVAGDLSLCLPKRQLDNIIETLHALDKIAPGTANYDTLLYGIECKYYSARPECTEDFEIKLKPNCYAIGDGAGFTRSLAQAAAQGLMVADTILKEILKGATSNFTL